MSIIPETKSEPSAGCSTWTHPEGEACPHEGSRTTYTNSRGDTHIICDCCSEEIGGSKEPGSDEPSWSDRRAGASMADKMREEIEAFEASIKALERLDDEQKRRVLNAVCGLLELDLS
jgi:hypothetical protein